MSLLSSARRLARGFGLEVHRYNIAESLDARFFTLLRLHGVDLAIDVGANDGGYGKRLRLGGYEGPIVSFEPLGDAYSALGAATAGDPSWQLAPRCALGRTNGKIEMHVAGNSTSSSIYPMLESHLRAAPHSANIGKEIVPIIRLDDIELSSLRTAKRALLKADTQGYEMPVLEGATETLKRCVGVQVELSLVPLYEGQSLYRDVIDWLDHKGFHLWLLLPGFSDPRTGQLLQMDGVFFRK